MAIQITISHKNKEYTLEYTRNSAKAIENMGFERDKVQSMPVTMIPLLVYGAFMRHHRELKQKEMDEIYKSLIGKTGKEGEEGFVNVLLEMYAETANTLFEEPADEGNAATWKVVRG